MDLDPVQQADPVPPARVPKRVRKNRRTIARRPKDEGPTFGREKRYSEAERTMMVQAVLKELTPAETVYVRTHGRFPNHKGAVVRLRRAYDDAYAQIVHWRRVALLSESDFEKDAAAQGPDAGQEDDASAVADTESDEESDGASNASSIASVVQGALTLAATWLRAVIKQVFGKETRPLPELPPELLPTRTAIKDEAKKWTRRFLQQGDVHDAPPSIKGQKRQRCEPILAQIHAKILEGWVDVDKRWHAYFSLDDLERRDRRKFDADRAEAPHLQKLQGQFAYHELRAQMGIATNRTVWQHLKATYPHLRRVKHSVRRARKDRKAVVVCSSSLLNCHAC